MQQADGKMAAPKDVWIKINTDGASKGNLGVAAAGGILRNNNRDFIRAFAGHLGFHSSIFAEAKTIFLGLRFAKRLDLNQVWVEIDSLILVNILNCLVDVPYSIVYIVRDTKLIVAEVGDCKFTHIHRECNVLADCIAN